MILWGRVAISVSLMCISGCLLPFLYLSIAMEISHITLMDPRLFAFTSSSFCEDMLTENRLIPDRAMQQCPARLSNHRHVLGELCVPEGQIE